jgi:hypothetical protein
MQPLTEAPTADARPRPYIYEQHVTHKRCRRTQLLCLSHRTTQPNRLLALRLAPITSLHSVQASTRAHPTMPCMACTCLRPPRCMAMGTLRLPDDCCMKPAGEWNPNQCLVIPNGFAAARASLHDRYRFCRERGGRGTCTWRELFSTQADCILPSWAAAAVLCAAWDV